MQTNNKMRVYISGQITGNENYKQQFKEAEEWLEKRGFEVINPADTFTQKIEKSLNYKQLLILDCFILINMCDAIFMLHGWQNSNGAKTELTNAKATGKRIMYQDKFKK